VKRESSLPRPLLPLLRKPLFDQPDQPIDVPALGAFLPMPEQDLDALSDAVHDRHANHAPHPHHGHHPERFIAALATHGHRFAGGDGQGIRGMGDVHRGGQITADRKDLEALMARFQIPQSHTRKAAGWIAEKFTELKLLVDDRQGGALLENWDASSIGIEGKRLLWC
jgi:hypothetical protein